MKSWPRSGSAGRRLDLQTSYGQALQLGKGFAAEETRAAFARVREFVRPNEDPAAQFAADYAQCLGSFFRGEFTAAQEIAETFLRDAEADGRATEAGAARRLLALVLFFQGDLKAARSFYERALADFVLERDGDARRIDGQAGGTAILASVVWHFGEVERARLLIEQAMRRARRIGPSRNHCPRAQLERLFGNPSRRRGSRPPRRRRVDQVGGRAWHRPLCHRGSVVRVLGEWSTGRSRGGRERAEAGSPGLYGQGKQKRCAVLSRDAC